MDTIRKKKKKTKGSHDFKTKTRFGSHSYDYMIYDQLLLEIPSLISLMVSVDVKHHVYLLLETTDRDDIIITLSMPGRESETLTKSSA